MYALALASFRLGFRRSKVSRIYKKFSAYFKTMSWWNSSRLCLIWWGLNQNVIFLNRLVVCIEKAKGSNCWHVTHFPQSGHIKVLTIPNMWIGVKIVWIWHPFGSEILFFLESLNTSLIFSLFMLSTHFFAHFWVCALIVWLPQPQINSIFKSCAESETDCGINMMSQK